MVFDLGKGAGRQDVDSNMDTTAIGYESFPVSAGRAGAVRAVESGTSGYRIVRPISTSTGRNLQGIQRTV